MTACMDLVWPLQHHTYAIVLSGLGPPLSSLQLQGWTALSSHFVVLFVLGKKIINKSSAVVAVVVHAKQQILLLLMLWKK